MHLVFYDANCPFCQKNVQLLLSIDSKKVLTFSPLQGETARDLFKGKEIDLSSLIFYENFGKENQKIWKRGKAIFKILRQLSPPWRYLGYLYWLPGIDIIYRIIAYYRHTIFPKKKGEIKIPPDQFIK